MRADLEYLNDIVKAARFIDDCTVGLVENDFGESELLQSAVLFKLMVIGEAATRISEALKSQHANIDWKAIAGFRNIIVHAYFRLSLRLVWESATIRVPELREAVLKIVNNEMSDST